MAEITAQLSLDVAKLKTGLEQARAEMKGFKSRAQADGKGVGESMGKGISEGIKSQLTGGLGGGIISSLMSGLGLGTGIAGIIGGMKYALGSFRDLQIQADKLGTSVESVQRLSPVARSARVDVESLGTSLLRLEKNLGSGDDPKLAEALKRLGLNAADLIGMPIDQKILALAEAFQKGRKEGTGVHDVAQLLGRSFQDLIPILSMGTDHLRDMMAAVKPVDDGMVSIMASMDEMMEKQQASLLKKGKGALGQASVNLESFIRMIIQPGSMGHDQWEAEQMKAVEAAVNEAAQKDQDRASAKRARQKAEDQQIQDAETKRLVGLHKETEAIDKLKDANKALYEAEMQANMIPLERQEYIKSLIRDKQSEIDSNATAPGAEAAKEGLRLTGERIKLETELAKITKGIEGSDDKKSAANSKRGLDEGLKSLEDYQKSLEHDISHDRGPAFDDLRKLGGSLAGVRYDNPSSDKMEKQIQVLNQVRDQITIMKEAVIALRDKDESMQVAGF